MKNKRPILLASLAITAAVAQAKQQPNIVVVFADDISAREIPAYGSSKWSGHKGNDVQDMELRASTPVMDQLAKEGVLISTCWSNTISSPSRAQMMTGRYAYQTKWWHNGDFGRYKNEAGKQDTWHLYLSSPLMMGKMVQNQGYATFWAGKTQMQNTDTNINDYGFDEGCYTPGMLNNHSPLTDFNMTPVKAEDHNHVVKDSGAKINTYTQISTLWYPSVMTVNTPHNTERNKMQPWPANEKDMKNYGLNTFGPDVELEFIFNFMERKQKEKRPFFIYHTSHLGHDAYDFIRPESQSKWPGTPVVKWDGKRYIRTEPNITGDKGVYDVHGTVTEPGMYNHINYLDYQIWQYLEKFKQMGIDDNTIFIFTADNATSGYGKANIACQKGMHVPFMIYAPCLKMTKSGQQDVLMNISDVYATIAEVVGAEIPTDYTIDGVSMLPFLTTNREKHRDWIYSYRSQAQMIRGDLVLRDGRGTWFDVTAKPADLISFPQIKDWSKVSQAHRDERDKLLGILPKYDQYKAEHDGPGGIYRENAKMKSFNAIMERTMNQNK